MLVRIVSGSEHKINKKIVDKHNAGLLRYQGHNRWRELVLEWFYKGVLLFSHETLLLPILIVGYHFLHRPIFERATALLLFTMITSVFFKSLWQIPLPEPLIGWAFPSGHMSAAITFWGWLAYEYRNRRFSVFVLFGLVALGFSLVHMGYHRPIDIAGSIGISSLSLLLYHFASKYYNKEIWKLYMSMALMGFAMTLTSENFTAPAWVGTGGLVALALGAQLNMSFTDLRLFSFRKLLVLILSTIILYSSRQALKPFIEMTEPMALFFFYGILVFWVFFCLDWLCARGKTTHNV